MYKITIIWFEIQTLVELNDSEDMFPDEEKNPRPIHPVMVEAIDNYFRCNGRYGRKDAFKTEMLGDISLFGHLIDYVADKVDGRYVVKDNVLKFEIEVLAEKPIEDNMEHITEILRTVIPACYLEQQYTFQFKTSWRQVPFKFVIQKAPYNITYKKKEPHKIEYRSDYICSSSSCSL